MAQNSFVLLDKVWQKGKEFLGVKKPIISGGMTWLSDHKLAKAVSDCGAFPVIAAGNMTPEELEHEIDACVKTLKTPFAVNLITIAPNYRAHCDLILNKNVQYVIFAGSFPRKIDIREMKKQGIKTLSFASERTIAARQIDYGVDALILEGSEAGGHIGYVSLIILLQQVLFQFRDFPIFVAGGLADGRLMAYLLLMGAYGCQFGSLFVCSDECNAHPKFKEAFIRARARQAMATPQYDSRLPVVAVRAIKNRATDEFGKLQYSLLQQLEKGEITRDKAQYEVEKFWVGSLRKAVIDGDVDFGSLMAGQSVGLINEIKPIREIIERLMQDAEGELQRLATLFDRFK
ncbi:MAG: nitronate monooxygenase family protein [candidate division WOR-3 bacterium]|nr:nitronate monooxygenase family protein [candidate division WOR-3 bacterium]